LDVTIPNGGYLYTYVANEANVSSATSVYFDDFTIVHTRSTPTLQVLQTSDYYPFGLQIAAQSYQKQTAHDNDYLYNGKELQDEHNLGWMDYGARMYDNTIGRWHVIDPLAEKFHQSSPFVYVLNSPIDMYDPDGMDVFESSGGTTLTGEDAATFWAEEQRRNQKRRSETQPNEFDPQYRQTIDIKDSNIVINRIDESIGRDQSFNANWNPFSRAFWGYSPRGNPMSTKCK